MTTHYSLQVIRVQDVNWNSTIRRKTLKLYAKIKLGNDKWKTRTMQPGDPDWDQTFTLSTMKLESDVDLFVKVKHKSRLPVNPPVGSAVIKVDDLLQKSAEGEVRIDLLASKNKSTLPSATGAIYLRLEVISDAKKDEILSKSAKDALNQLRSPEDVANNTGTSASECMASQLGMEGPFYKAVKNLVEKVDRFTGLIDQASAINPYVSAAWQMVSALYRAVRDQFEADEKAIELVHIIEEIFIVIGDADFIRDKIKTLRTPIKEFLQQTTECCLFLREYARTGFLKRMLDAGGSEKINQFQGRFHDLKNALSLGIGLQTAFVSARISQSVDILYLRELLNPARMDASERSECLPGTRTEYLKEIMAWVFSETEENMLWLRGVAGSGKSTISMTISEYCLKMRRRGAYLFFERGKNEPSSVIRTISFWLASFDQSIARHVIEAVKNNSGITEASLKSQAEEILLQPLMAATSDLGGPIVVILDALDECGTPNSRGVFLQLLQKEFPRLPRIFRFIITSRVEPDINNALSIPSVRAMDLDYSSPSGRDDVHQYIDHEMQAVLAAAQLQLPSNWPWDENIRLLSNTASGLFIWASTAVKQVSRSDSPFDALEQLLSYCQFADQKTTESAEVRLDSLYDSVLKNTGILWTNRQSRQRFSRVLGLILLCRIPLSVGAIDGLLGLPPTSSSRLIISRLQSVLAYDPDVPDAPVRLFHASFSDYLLAPERQDQVWFIDVADQQAFVTSRCFDVMAGELRFNICDFESSFERNVDVTALEDRVKERISSQLDYSCRFWAEHLCKLPCSSDSPSLLNKLERFAKRDLLYWFEVLSLIGYFKRVASRALLDATLWTASHLRELSSFLWDAYRLASIFSIPMSESVPHIYLSALSLSRGESLVADHYSTIGTLLQVRRFGKKSAISCMKVFEVHDSAVNAVVFSPDGRRVVCGCKLDQKILVCEAESGEVIFEIEGHFGSLALSPDGRRIASASEDQAICIWEMERGELVSGPFEDQHDVYDLVYSPDGKRLASASRDGYLDGKATHGVRVWNVETGKIISGPFQGVSHYVHSMIFSPDGKHVLLCLPLVRISIWDAETGQLLSTVLGERATFDVPTLELSTFDSPFAFSPNSAFLVSTYLDETSLNSHIRMWDTRSGKIVLSPEERGHSGMIRSVTFSPDGSRIASGSHHGEVLVWDSRSGENIFGPFKTINECINAIAFSPDSKRVVSGSFQGVHMWDAEAGKFTRSPYEGSCPNIISVKFSSDTKSFVTNNVDNVLCVLDTETGDHISEPFQARDPIGVLALSSDGRRVAISYRNVDVDVWDIRTNNTIAVPFKFFSAIALTFSPDGRQLALGAIDGTVRVWDIGAGELVGLHREHVDIVRSITYSPDGQRVVSAAYDGSIRAWNIGTEETSVLFENKAENVTCVAFSPEGNRIAFVLGDKVVQLMDPESGEVVANMSSFKNPVWTVYFSSDGKRLFCTGSGKTAGLWHTENVNVFMELPALGFASFSPNEIRIIQQPRHEAVIHISAVRPRISKRTLPDSRANSASAAGPPNSASPVPCPGDGSSPGITNMEVFLAQLGITSRWKESQDGWLVGKQGELLVWIPRELRASLWQPEDTAIANYQFSTKLDFTGCILGEGWHKNFKGVK